MPRRVINDDVVVSPREAPVSNLSDYAYEQKSANLQVGHSHCDLFVLALPCGSLIASAGYTHLQSRSVLAKTPATEQMDHAGCTDNGYRQG